MKTFEVDVGGKTYEVDAPDANTAWTWANQTHRQSVKPLTQVDQNGPKDMPMFSAEGTLYQVKNMGMGALKGASRIGNTIVGSVMGDRKEREKTIDQFFGENSDPNSLAFKTGDIGTQIAGTAGATGALAKGAAAIPALAKYAPAIASGGFNLGAAKTGKTLADGLTRAGTGAVGGYAMSGMVSPEDAGTGAAISAALPATVATAGKIGELLGRGARAVGSNVLGAATGTGSEAVKAAYSAGKSGSTEFLDNMRGNVQFDDIVDKAKQGLAKMRETRGAQYRSGMIDIKADKNVIDMAPIEKAVNSISSMGSFKGQQINKNASGVVKEIEDTVANWAKLNPAEYHTPEGLDALKQAIGDIRDVTQFGTPARNSANAVYNAIKSEIQAQAPTYAKVMKDYSEASNTLKEVEKALSLGEKASKDTAIRKLQSLMRNNVNTNYGNRMSLANELERQGGVSLTPSIAGQAMSSAMPRGLAGPINSAGIGGAAMLGNPAVLAAAPFTSPRLMGEALYGMGAASRGVSKAPEYAKALAAELGIDLAKLPKMGSAKENAALRAALLTSAIPAVQQ